MTGRRGRSACAAALALAALLTGLDAAALPTKREAFQARREIEETLGSALRQHKAGKIAPARLARMLLLLARAEESEARRLLLLQAAAVTGVEGGDLALAAEAVRRLRTEIPGMTDEVLEQVVRLALRKAKPAEAPAVRRRLLGEEGAQGGGVQ